MDTIALILAALQAAAQLEPTIAGIIPVVQKQFAVLGGSDSFNDDDLAALATATAAIDAKVAALEANAGTGTG